MQTSFRYHTRARGTDVEIRAQQFLREAGYRILAANVFFRVGELDIVAEDVPAGELVFVEVRSRVSARGRESPLESLSFGKLRHLRMAAELYMVRMSSADLRKFRGIRLDLLGWDGRAWNWVKNLH